MIHAGLEGDSENLFLSKTAKSWLSAFNLTLAFSVLVALMLGTPRVEMLLPVVFLLVAVDPMTEFLSALKRHHWRSAVASAIMLVCWCLLSFVIARVVWDF